MSSWWPDPAAYGATLAGLQAEGVRTVDVDITEVVSLEDHQPGRVAGFLTAFEQLVTEAAADGITVEAAAGDPSWAAPGAAGPGQVLAAAARVEADLGPGVLGGVQFDVEPWALPGWSTHRAADAGQWVTFVGATARAFAADGVTGQLGFTVPYWFDGVGGGVPEVTVGGHHGYPFPLALQEVGGTAAPVFDVMAYRNVATGPGGSLAEFAPDRADVPAGSPATVLLGQETGPSQPPDTTFYGTSCAAFRTAQARIATALAGAAHYGGTAVDDVETLLALCPPA